MSPDPAAKLIGAFSLLPCIFCFACTLRLANHFDKFRVQRTKTILRTLFHPFSQRRRQPHLTTPDFHTLLISHLALLSFASILEAQ